MLGQSCLIDDFSRSLLFLSNASFLNDTNNRQLCFSGNKCPVQNVKVHLHVVFNIDLLLHLEQLFDFCTTFVLFNSSGGDDDITVIIYNIIIY